ncbi:MAG TPA: LUD domain-containing protein [Candidatus Eremiobacteraceae bacterium]|nr:LUD domain-containing protein [Candidatus Eremiobacteraceae bacterium]
MNDDSSRARFLARVSEALGRNAVVMDPPVRPSTAASPPLEEEASRDLLALAERFRDELAAVSGDTVFVSDADAVDAEIARIVRSRSLGPISSDVAKSDYAVLRAEALIADTGSAIIIERTADRRLAPYMPRTCIIVADAASLHPTMSSASLAALHAAARQGDKGEAVIITGPARTADIEKTLVLGAHGPRHLTVIIAGVSPDDESLSP